MIERWDLTIPRLTGDRPRKAYVYLPVGYGKSDTRYPVMYMFDGHNLFTDEEATYGKCWGLADYLDYTETPIIIAAVECNTVGHGRLSEYSPVDFNFRDGTPIKGRGKKYMDWLVSEFKPYIDQNYRTLPDRGNTAIGGSSMGGLMTLYALGKYNKYFSKGAALSPSLWAYGEDAANTVAQFKMRRDTLLYMDYGSREFSNHDVQRNIFAEVTAQLVKMNINVTSRIVAGGVHSESSWQKQIPFFMNVLGFMPNN